MRHPACEGRRWWDASCLEGLIPASHSEHRLHSLAPYGRSPISVAAQKQPIQRIPAKVQGLRGWIISGPAGSSKTTYVAAALTDMLTFRSLESSKLNYWRIKVPKWLCDMEAYETRDFGSRVDKPDPRPQDIEEMTRETGVRPILWLEEVDKFVPTKNRLRNLFTLIDITYEQTGLIISTANEKLLELQKLLGEPIYRRLTGDNDDPTQFLVWDFWKLEKNNLTAC